MFTKWCLSVSVRQLVAMIKALHLGAKAYVDFNKNAAFSWAWNHRSHEIITSGLGYDMKASIEWMEVVSDEFNVGEEESNCTILFYIRQMV